MKQIATQYLLPFVVALTLLYGGVFHSSLNHWPFSDPALKSNYTHCLDALAFFNENGAYKQAFLQSDSYYPVITLLGSSELLSDSKALPHRFINSLFPVKTKALGHAGNQCLSIYCQLLANEAKLKVAPAVIVISPGWFESIDLHTEFSPSQLLPCIYSVRCPMI
jgi:poly-D-alanine transfer protein DltD